MNANSRNPVMTSQSTLAFVTLFSASETTSSSNTTFCVISRERLAPKEGDVDFLKDQSQMPRTIINIMGPSHIQDTEITSPSLFPLGVVVSVDGKVGHSWKLHPFLGSLETKDPSGHTRESPVQMKGSGRGRTETVVGTEAVGGAVEIRSGLAVIGTEFGITITGDEVGIAVFGDEVGISVVEDVRATVGLESSSSSPKVSKILFTIEVPSSFSPPSNKPIRKSDRSRFSSLEASTAVGPCEDAGEIARLAKRSAVVGHNMVVIESGPRLLLFSWSAQLLFDPCDCKTSDLCLPLIFHIGCCSLILDLGR